MLLSQTQSVSLEDCCCEGSNKVNIDIDAEVNVGAAGTAAIAAAGSEDSAAAAGAESEDAGAAAGAGSEDAGAAAGAGSEEAGEAAGADSEEAGAAAGAGSEDAGAAAGADSEDAGAAAGAGSEEAGAAADAGSEDVGAAAGATTGTETEDSAATTEEEEITVDENGVAVFPQMETCEACEMGNTIMTACGMETDYEVPDDTFGALQLSYHNQARAAHGAKPLTWDSDLAAEAQAYAEEL